jgi:ABC-type transport system involved in multi-copper enzyme maturation permease subunit
VSAVRLLRAELRKLNRPLLWGVMVSSALFCVLLAVGGSANARLDGGGGDLRTAAQLHPVAAGAEAAGLMASLPGALAIALLAGGHAGGEWSGRTLKNLLVQHGRRRRVLAAKLVSLWIAGVALVAACWAGLAVAGPVLVRVDHLPDPHQSLAAAASWAGSQVGRSLLVLAVFAAVGLLAAVLTRNTIGTTAATAGAFVVMLAVAALPGGGAWTPATWVQGWMGFPAGEASITALPSNFWSRFIDASGAAPGHLLGLAGLLGTLIGCGAVALVVFQRGDVSG